MEDKQYEKYIPLTQCRHGWPYFRGNKAMFDFLDKYEPNPTPHEATCWGCEDFKG